VRSLDDVRFNCAHTGESIDDGGNERREKNHHDLRRIPEAKPQDGERNPGQWRNRANKQESGIDQCFSAPTPSHQQAQGDADRDGDEKSHDHKLETVQRVLDQSTVGIPNRQDLLRRLPELKRRGKTAGANRAGDHRQQRPRDQEHTNRGSS
jgi:hypothetical protein